MNSLNLYYSYIKSPYATPSFNNCPRFILTVENSIQIQKTTIIILEINNFVYIPIIRYISEEKTYERTINNARSPPIYKFLFSVSDEFVANYDRNTIKHYIWCKE